MRDTELREKDPAFGSEGGAIQIKTITADKPLGDRLELVHLNSQVKR